MIDVWFLDHGVHCILDRASLKLKRGVFLPDLQGRTKARPISFSRA